MDRITIAISQGRFRSSNRRHRGFTLLEILVAGVIGLVVTATAAAVFATSYKQKLISERKMMADAAATAALIAMERDIESAGSDFPSPMFAIRVLNSPATLQNGDGTTETGLVAGTDVVELAYGNRERVPGNVNSALIEGSQVKLTFKGTTAPFRPTDSTSHVLLFADASQENACIGISSLPTGTQSTLTMLDQDYMPSAASTCVQPQSSTRCCPNQASTTPCLCARHIYMLDHRVRYLVRQDQGRVGLYKQITTSADGRFTAAATTTTLIQLGIEDLQIAGRLKNNDGIIQDTDNCKSAPSGLADAAYCYCNFTQGGCPTGVSPANAPKLPERIRGLKIAVSAVGERPYIVKGARPPNLYDHDQSAAPTDDIQRSVMQRSLNLPNLTLVALTTQ